MVVPTLSRLGDRVYIPLYPCNNSSPYLIFLSQNSNMSPPPPPTPYLSALQRIILSA